MPKVELEIDVEEPTTVVMYFLPDHDKPSISNFIQTDKQGGYLRHIMQLAEYLVHENYADEINKMRRKDEQD